MVGLLILVLTLVEIQPSDLPSQPSSHVVFSYTRNSFTITINLNIFHHPTPSDTKPDTHTPFYPKSIQIF